MARSLRSLLCVAALQALLPVPTGAIPPGLWNFDPDYNATLPPLDEIPPLSRNATRDHSLLKYQIIGIVGGYVITVLFLYTLLFTIGGRLRRAAQSSHGTLSMEMVKPNRWMQDPSPQGKSMSSFQRWAKKTPTTSPASTAQPTFDNNVIMSHKEQQEKQMERLYAAVFENETKSPREVSVKENEIGSTHGHTRNLSNASKRSFSQRQPPQLAAQAYTNTTPTSPRSPVVGHQPAGYPRSVQSAHSREGSDTSSIRGRGPTTAPNTVQQQQQRSNKTKSTRSVRNLTISAPIPTNRYPGVDKDDEASTPLSPRYPQNLEPLPSPSRARPITPIQDEFDEEDPSVTGPFRHEELDEPRPLPRAAPQRINTNLRDARLPPPLPPPPKDISPISAGSTSNALPFRQHASAASASSLDGSTAEPSSPGATKTTLVSPRRDRFAPGQGHPHGFIGMGGPSSAGLVSAGLATPYSPYMPFSPITPVTPRLTTRAERKQRQKEEGRRVANAEQDLVKDEKEMWGDGW